MREGETIFNDREDAGEKLWPKIKDSISEDSMILAVPRGGIKVASSVCEHASMGMDIIIPKKLRAPFNSEIAIGAVAEDNIYVINEEATAYLELSEGYIRKEVDHQVTAIKAVREKYHLEHLPNIAKKSVIIIDDGIATGMTLLAVVKYLKLHNAREMIIAAPVASKEAVYLLESNGAQVIVCHIPEDFRYVGSYYEKFAQVDDEEVQNLLERHYTGIKEGNRN